MLKIIRNNPKAFLFALLIHIALLAALSFSTDWNSSHKVAAPKVNVIQAVMIDESKIRAEEQRKDKIEAQKRKKSEAERRRKQEDKRKKELKKKQDAEKKRKAEVERKRKKEELRKNQEIKKKRLAEQEQKRKIEAEKERQAEAERKRKAEERRQAAEERQRQEDATRRAEEQRFLQEQMAAEEARLGEIRQGELRRESDRLIDQIRRRVESKWLKPSGWQAGISCTVNVRLVPGIGGSARVIDARIIKSCGQALFDHSVETAVFNASPLPFPTSPELMETFREITFEFEPEE